MTQDMPTGVVTFVFTDIEGSTKLVQTLGDDWTAVLVDQRRLLRAVWERWRGNERGTEGDSFFVAFSSVSDAVNACVEGQRALLAHDWPGGAVVKVRMGLHTGEPVIAGDDYVGIDVHRAARIASAAHGGQIVLSKASLDLLGANMPPGVSAFDLGEHRLKDLPEPEWIFQLNVEGLPEDFPALKSLETPHVIPHVAGSLIGRDRELAAIASALADPKIRCLTLTGPGGAGKTRLAIEAATRALDAFRNGVFFVALGSVMSADAVVPAIAQVLSIEGGTSQLLERIRNELRPRAVLLVLDNFEHVAGAAASVGELLAGAPRVKVVTTSRVPLRISAEREFAVEPLERTDAEELFIQRAALVRPGFVCTEADAPVIAEICRRLDGLPLAIELAAARMRVLSAQQLLERLGNTLGLAGRARDVPSRQQTLRDTIAWSVDLLERSATELFSTMAVFRAGATLEALESVADRDPLEDLQTLVEHSLVRAGSDERFTMLETIREYGMELLASSPAAPSLRDRHAEFFAGVARDAYPELRGPAGPRWRAVLDAELPNINEALMWTLRDDAGEERTALGAQIAGWMGWFWYSRSVNQEAVRWLLSAEHLAGHAPDEVRARVAYALGIHFDQAGRADDAAEQFETARALFTGVGDTASATKALSSLGSAVRSRGDLVASRAMFEQVAEQWRVIGNPTGESNALFNLATLALDAGDGERALELLEEALRIDRGQGDDWAVALDKCGIGDALLALGRLDAAEAMLQEAMKELLALEERDRVAEVWSNFAGLAAQRGDLIRCARLAAAAFGLWEQIGLSPHGPDLIKAERNVAPAREKLPPEEFETATRQGRAMTFEQAAAYAAERS